MLFKNRKNQKEEVPVSVKGKGFDAGGAGYDLSKDVVTLKYGSTTKEVPACRDFNEAIVEFARDCGLAQFNTFASVAEGCPKEITSPEDAPKDFAGIKLVELKQFNKAGAWRV